MAELPPPLDPLIYGQLQELERSGAPGFLQDLSRQFVKQALAHLDLFSGFIRAKDGDGLFRAAHLLKGSAGSMGALALMELIRSLEAAGRSCSWTEAEALMPGIAAEFARVRAALENPA